MLQCKISVAKLKHQLITGYLWETEAANHTREVNYPHLDIKKHYVGKVLTLWCLFLWGLLSRNAFEIEKQIIRVK
jgi:hypothetical protein